MGPVPARRNRLEPPHVNPAMPLGCCLLPVGSPSQGVRPCASPILGMVDAQPIVRNAAGTQGTIPAPPPWRRRMVCFTRGLERVDKLQKHTLRMLGLRALRGRVRFRQATAGSDNRASLNPLKTPTSLRHRKPPTPEAVIMPPGKSPVGSEHPKSAFIVFYHVATDAGCWVHCDAEPGAA